MQPLSFDYILNAEKNKLQYIYDFEHTTKLLFGAQQRIKEINPYDYCFNALNIKLHLLEEESDDYKLLLTYINNGVSFKEKNYSYQNIYAKQSNLKAIFEVDHKNRDQIFSKIDIEKQDETF